MPVPRAILDLVQRFADNADEYTSGPYNETQVRLDFINPFCECLAGTWPPLEARIPLPNSNAGGGLG
jgi:hypothetical protein